MKEVCFIILYVGYVGKFLVKDFGRTSIYGEACFLSHAARRSLGYSGRIISNSVGNIEVFQVLKDCTKNFSRSCPFSNCSDKGGEGKALKEKGTLKVRK